MLESKKSLTSDLLPNISLAVDQLSVNISLRYYTRNISTSRLPGHIAQSVGHLTHKSEVLGSMLDTWSGHILSFLLPLIHEGQLSVTGESMCMKY